MRVELSAIGTLLAVRSLAIQSFRVDANMCKSVVVLGAAALLGWVLYSRRMPGV